MNVIANISCYFEHNVVTLKLHKEYLNTVTYNTPVFLGINTEQFVIYTVNRKKHTKMFFIYILQNQTDCDKLWYILS